MRIGSFINFLTAPDDARDALVVYLNYTDKNMTATEFGQYLQSLEDAGLIVSGAKERLMSTYGRLGVVEDDGDRALRIDTLLTLSRAELDAVASSADDTIRARGSAPRMQRARAGNAPAAPRSALLNGRRPPRRQAAD